MVRGMAAYPISEVAERTGLSKSTLRFYEDCGLIAPAGRSGNGYRTYNDRDVDRLRFIARSKHLGLSLADITGLVELFDFDECAPVQERLRELLVAKRRDLAEQIAELESLSVELARVGERLGDRVPAGACDDSCACVADDADAVFVSQKTSLRNDPVRDVPIACTLDAAAMPERLSAWRKLAASVAERIEVPDGVQVRFAPSVSAAEVADLAAKEHACCSFFCFSVGIGDGETTLTIIAPPEARTAIDALLPAS
jgi:MerR family transcriptional regulator, copper efflux regulator